MPQRTVAGKMRHLVDFQKNAATTPGSRGETNTDATADWQTQFRGYCELMPLAGNEVATAKQLQEEISHRITTRWIASATPRADWRIKYGSRLFHIVSVVNVEERNEFWEIIANELITE